MDIILMRHGKAESAQVFQSDDARELTTKGRKETETAIPFLKEKLDASRPLLINTSPAARAKQTARIVAEGLGVGNVSECGFVRSGDDDALMQNILQTADDAQLIVVGHEPHLSFWSGRLFGTPLVFQKGMAAAFRVTQRSPFLAELLWVMTPDNVKDKKKALSEPLLSRKNYADTLLGQSEAAAALREDILAQRESSQSVHAFRVEVRRLRSLITFIKPALDTAAFVLLRDDLKAMHNRLSCLRELDVLIKRWQVLREKHDLAESGVLPDLFEEERAQEAQKARAFLKSAYVPDALQALTGAVTSWRDAAAEPNAFHEFAFDRFKKWQDSVQKAVRKLDIRDYPAVHLTRILFKKLRYVQDAVPLLAGESRMDADRLKDIQDTLGSICDIYINIPLLEKLKSPPASREIGLFIGALMIEREQLEKQARSLLGNA